MSDEAPAGAARRPAPEPPPSEPAGDAPSGAGQAPAGDAPSGAGDARAADAPHEADVPAVPAEDAPADGDEDARAGRGEDAPDGPAAGAHPNPLPEEVPETVDFPPPEGAGRAASGDAPAPARQWPLISVLALAALGLLTVGVHPFDAAFRVGTIMVGAALVGGAVLRRTVPSVGMLAVRSRFTDMVTYGVLGVAIVLFALMIQPRPWLDIPVLQSVVHSTVP
ncbi:DUF3017 domain-containing protein [Streptomyces sp. NPDC047002]|uniref:DUF3017 domain-containing protein n=1 Tax=Streptomyces sp. NPDC047002 TaxID=3155475 RepID=UPI0034518D24